jgi:hypothetical protein
MFFVKSQTAANAARVKGGSPDVEKARREPRLLRESALTLVSPCSGSCTLQQQQHHQLKHRVFVFGPLLTKPQHAC